MGADIGSMKDSANIPQKTSNMHTTEQKESLNHTSRFIKQNQIDNEMEAIQDAKVDKILLLNIVTITFFLLLFLLCSSSSSSFA
jgi:hypothetical protein